MTRAFYAVAGRALRCRPQAVFVSRLVWRTSPRLTLDPGRFLHMGTQASQSIAAHLDNQIPVDSPRAISRTIENDPAKHGDQHEGQHYNISPQDLKTVFPHGLPPRFAMQVKTFSEACLMVRKPALELLHYLKNTNFAYPAVRYLLYGEKGTGKTLSLCHVIHFCAKQDWLILHIPDAHLWVKNCQDLLQSNYNKQRFDQPLEASTWLKNFKTTNERFLNQIKVQEQYVWNKRESTEKGSPLGEVVEQGITRVRNATDAVGIVLKELKRQSSLGIFHLLVAVDGINALWGRTTLKREDKSPIAPEELALVHNLRKMMKNDWHGGAIVSTLSQTGSLFKPRKAYLPQELLGKEGFDALDPFIPILVSNYNPKEFESCIQYYLENNWLQHEKGPSFSFFLSGLCDHSRIPLSQSLDLFFHQQQPLICTLSFILTSFWLINGTERWVEGCYGLIYKRDFIPKYFMIKKGAKPTPSTGQSFQVIGFLPHSP
ncbi:28S ribosomal protein S29, mitochondrial isoform X2 [Piliocolobus tephrosceles]|uniref:28S ribosomal protein S29, mitochondrial isoform X2 n=1 Tax=Piliocolobus tephrosceles TaxID=591936 RepID=UPI000E6B3508|nr:28S ribosomal protein S29, mitochondrial isoform X2 [Piliocolobus tephrosceles]